MGKFSPEANNACYTFYSKQSSAGARNGNRTRTPALAKRRILSYPCSRGAPRKPAWILGYWLRVQCAKCLFCTELGRKSPELLVRFGQRINRLDSFRLGQVQTPPDLVLALPRSYPTLDRPQAGEAGAHFGGSSSRRLVSWLTFRVICGLRQVSGCS